MFTVVPDFRTGVEPVVASPTSEFPASAKGGISVDANMVRQGSVARFYVNGLKVAVRGKADASSLFWYAYVYSSPLRLMGPDGAPVRDREEGVGRPVLFRCDRAGGFERWFAYGVPDGRQGHLPGVDAGDGDRRVDGDDVPVV